MIKARFITSCVHTCINNVGLGRKKLVLSYTWLRILGFIAGIVEQENNDH